MDIWKDDSMQGAIYSVQFLPTSQHYHFPSVSTKFEKGSIIQKSEARSHGLENATLQRKEYLTLWRDRSLPVLFHSVVCGMWWNMWFTSFILWYSPYAFLSPLEHAWQVGVMDSSSTGLSLSAPYMLLNIGFHTHSWLGYSLHHTELSFAFTTSQTCCSHLEKC